MKPVPSVIDTSRNSVLIARVAPLWLRPDDLVLDPTWGRGGWWRVFRPARLVTSDLDPVKGSVTSDYRALPHPAECFDVVAFDPAYVPQGGRTTSTIPQMQEAYGMLSAKATPKETAADIAIGIAECARVLRTGSRGLDGKQPGGRLLVKCMDYVTGGVYFEGERFVGDAASAAGLSLWDKVIHHGGPGPQPALNPDGTLRRQVHTRREHSVLLCFQKTRPRRRTNARP